MNLREKETICKEYEYVCVCINLGAYTLECTKSFSSTYVVFTSTLLTSCLLGIKKKFSDHRGSLCVFIQPKPCVKT